MNTFLYFWQGSVLSSFFWGYTMTQFLGGYLSDRIGGDVVLPIAAVFWAIITFWTPQLAYLSQDKYLALQILLTARVLLGVFQGKFAQKYGIRQFYSTTTSVHLVFYSH